jgi:hypothetical protein
LIFFDLSWPPIVFGEKASRFRASVKERKFDPSRAFQLSASWGAFKSFEVESTTDGLAGRSTSSWLTERSDENVTKRMPGRAQV